MPALQYPKRNTCPSTYRVKYPSASSARGFYALVPPSTQAGPIRWPLPGRIDVVSGILVPIQDHSAMETAMDPFIQIFGRTLFAAVGADLAGFVGVDLVDLTTGQ